ncbi:sensor histidine kinase [Prescottella subtropica]|uniref:sensor histidine kinase n=1 Tax=Prescottella subtropica TaxID=2545757 RepID=UPI0010F4EEA6|nr:HAMP domain-containing sensor histidine kinase [Prescottella subtropica]
MHLRGFAAAVPQTPIGRARRLTIRARLTLTYAGLVTAVGAALIAIVYLFMYFMSVNFRLAVPATPEGVLEVDVPLTALTNFLDTMLVTSIVTLAVLALASAAVGWFVAGRMLAPLAALNAAATRAAAGDLSQQLALSGPRDELRDLADTFDRMLSSLAESLNSHRRFAANASHELRTPLAATQTMIDVALADPQATTADLRALAERIREVNRANAETVTALLELAQSQSGLLTREEVDVTALVHESLTVVVPEAAALKVALPRPASQPATVNGDRVLLRQALTNLLRNGIRHNVPDGAVQLECEVDAAAVRILVRNDGPPVPAELLATLTEPFVRGSGRARTHDGGHGLGLALVAAVAEAHAGQLTLTANPDGGLTALLQLPR